ncbi:DUF881 domain-containing protein [Halobacillus sp. MO56]
MSKRSKWLMSIIFAIVGFMVAIQFQTASSEPELRDTRDQWEVRQELQEQQKLQQELLEQITKADSILEEYDEVSDEEKLETLKGSIEQLEQQAGLTSLEGSGITIKLAPIFQEWEEDAPAYPTVSPSLLTHLINELNTFGAEGIAVGEERVVSLSPIRNVNGDTYVNNRPMQPLPVEIKVLTSNPQKMLDYVNASRSRDMFALDDISLDVQAEKNMKLPGYDDNLQLGILELDSSKETGEN